MNLLPICKDLGVEKEWWTNKQKTHKINPKKEILGLNAYKNLWMSESPLHSRAVFFCK